MGKNVFRGFLRVSKVPPVGERADVCEARTATVVPIATIWLLSLVAWIVCVARSKVQFIAIEVLIYSLQIC